MTFFIDRVSPKNTQRTKLSLKQYKNTKLGHHRCDKTFVWKRLFFENTEIKKCENLKTSQLHYTTPSFSTIASANPFLMALNFFLLSFTTILVFLSITIKRSKSRFIQNICVNIEMSGEMSGGTGVAAAISAGAVGVEGTAGV